MKLIKVLIVIVVLVVGMFLCILIPNLIFADSENFTNGFSMSDEKIIKKANKLYGQEICTKVINNVAPNDMYEDADHPSLGGQAITSWRCEICKKFYQHGSTNTPILCDECARIANRCYKCGNLLGDKTNENSEDKE